MDLPPAVVRVLFDLIAVRRPLEFSQLAGRNGLNTSATSSVLRTLQRHDAVRSDDAVPGLNRPKWEVTEAGRELAYAIEAQEHKAMSQPVAPVRPDAARTDAAHADAARTDAAHADAAHAANMRPANVRLETVPVKVAVPRALAPGVPATGVLAPGAAIPGTVARTLPQDESPTEPEPLLYTRLTPTTTRKSRRAQRRVSKTLRTPALPSPRSNGFQPSSTRRIKSVGRIGTPGRTSIPVPFTAPGQRIGRKSRGDLQGNPRSNRTSHSAGRAAGSFIGTFAQVVARAATRTGAGVSVLLGSRRRVITTLLILAVATTGAFALAGIRSVNFVVTGIEPNAVLHPSNLVDNRLNFEVEGGQVTDARLRLDGLPVSGLQRSNSNLSWVVPALTDGTHTVSLEVPRQLFGTAVAAVSFTVDSVPPDLGIPEVLTPVPLDQPFVLTSEVDPGTDLLIDGVPVDTSSGTFTIARDLPPAGPISIVAVDEAGNTTALDVVVPIAYPETNGVHVTAAAWAHDGLREGILDLIEANQITAVQLDLKDESGYIGYASDIELAKQSGSTQGLFELKDAIDQLHGLGVRVIGRVVAFRDPALGRYAARTGNLDWVLQTQSGAPLPTPYGTGAFTNFNNETVRKYNLDIAAEAAEAGIDDVLWDYMRRPEGDFSEVVTPGFDGTDPSPLIVSFLAEAGQMLREYQVYHGVSVFGISARRGDLIAQDVVAISDHVDYVSPMVYPSHWGRGEYGVSHPEAQPYDIVEASLSDFQQVLAGTNTVIVPWLQDFTQRVKYGPDEVRAQIDAASDIGIDNWLLWDPTVTYTEEALPAG